MKLFTIRNSGIILLLVLGVVFIFHVLILLGIISTNAIWGGQIPGDQLLFYEVAAMFVLIVFAFIIAAKASLIGYQPHRLVLRFGPWIVFTYLALNTAGNLLADGIEKWFSLVTFILSILAFRIAASK